MTVLPTFMTLIHASYQEFCRSIGVVAKIPPPPPHKNGPGLDFSPGKASYRFDFHNFFAFIFRTFWFVPLPDLL